MERDEIRSNLARIAPTSYDNFDLGDDEVWEGDQGRAHFKVSRIVLPLPDSQNMFSLSVSGDDNDKARLIREFVETLGPPMDMSPHPTNPRIDMFSWLITQE